MTALSVSDLVEDKKIWPLLFTFLGLLAASSAVFNYFMIHMGLLRYYVAGFMCTPFLSAFLTLKIYKIPLSHLGLNGTASKYNIISYFLPLFYGLVAYGIVWGFGLGGLINEKFLDGISYKLGLNDWPLLSTLIFGTIFLSSIGALWHIITAAGEEVGWRGFLVPILMRKFNFVQTSIISGLIWAVWHYPLIMYTTYNSGPDNMLFQLACFTVLYVGMSFIFTYYRLKAASVWPAIMLHAGHSVFILTQLNYMTVKYDVSIFYIGEFGIILPALMLVVAGIYYRKAKQEGMLPAITDRVKD